MGSLDFNADLNDVHQQSDQHHKQQRQGVDGRSTVQGKGDGGGVDAASSSSSTSAKNSGDEAQPMQQQQQEGGGLMQLLADPSVLVFLWRCVVMGFGLGVLGNYEFLYLKQLGAPETLIGMALLVRGGEVFLGLKERDRKMTCVRVLLASRTGM
jgi:hypothetical protein